MSSNWRSQLKQVDAAAIAKAQEATRGGGFQLDCQYSDSRYVPNIDSSKLPKDKYKGGFFPVRLLPPPGWAKYDQPVYTVYKYPFFSKFGRGFDNVDCAKTVNPKWSDPIKELQSMIYDVGSERARDFAKQLYPQPRHFLAVACRLIELIDREDGQKRYFKNAVKVLSLPDKPVTKLIWPAWSDEEVGDPTNIDSARDLRLHVTYAKKPIGNKEVNVPEYDESKFSMELTPLADTEKEMERIYNEIPDLSKEYKPCDTEKLEDMAQRIYDIFKGKDTSKSVGVDGNKGRPVDESGDEDEDPKPRSRKPAKDDDDIEEETPRARRRPADEEDDDEPKARSRKPVDEEDEAPRSRRRSSEDEEDEAPRSRRRDEDDEDEAPRSRRRPVEDEDDEPKARSRKPVDEDEDDEPKARSRKPVDDEDEAPRPRRRAVEDDEDEAPRSRRRNEDEDDEPRARRAARVPEDEEDEKPKARAKAPVADADGEDDWFDKRLDQIDPKRKKNDD